VIVGEQPEPTPGPGEVRIKMHAAGIGPWDVKIMQGMVGELRLPYVIGFEFAGTVDQLGTGVSGVAVGARVFGVSSRNNRDYVQALGAEAVFDYHDDEWPDRVRKSVPDGVDALFDCAGGDTLTRAFEPVKDNGRAVGIVFGGSESSPRGISFERFSAAAGRPRLEKLTEMANQGKLRVELAAQLPLEQAREALERVAAGHTRGKVVLTLG